MAFPMVFIEVSDLIGAGFIANLAHPLINLLSPSDV
jgi:hypothetical protein